VQVAHPLAALVPVAGPVSIHRLAQMTPLDPQRRPWERATDALLALPLPHNTRPGTLGLGSSAKTHESPVRHKCETQA
jgi:hypothetical protein